jgi:cell division protein ZapB
MSTELLQKLEDKIDNAVETIELLRLQNDELEDKYTKQLNENAQLKSKQAAWEQNLATMLEKLDAIEPKSSSFQSSSTSVEQEESLPV